jgi:hypothetical protein
MPKLIKEDQLRKKYSGLAGSKGLKGVRINTKPGKKGGVILMNIPSLDSSPTGTGSKNKNLLKVNPP